jgi:hypothetical protein
VAELCNSRELHGPHLPKFSSEPCTGNQTVNEPKAGVNEYGTPVTGFRCKYCKETFTVCPAVPPEKFDQWDGCLGDNCSSYDINRDPTYLFAPDDPDLYERGEQHD